MLISRKGRVVRPRLGWWAVPLCRNAQGFVVPIDERGKLNCKRFFGTREKLRQFQHAFAKKMEPLGLERGVEGSRATHTDVQRFYGMINQRVRLRVKPEAAGFQAWLRV
jgi:hypothetical protein